MENKNPTPLGARINRPETKVPIEQRTDSLRQGFRRTSTIPTKRPRTYYESILIYVNGATKRLYVYDMTAGLWYYTALT